MQSSIGPVAWLLPVCRHSLGGFAMFNTRFVEMALVVVLLHFSADKRYSALVRSAHLQTSECTESGFCDRIPYHEMLCSGGPNEKSSVSWSDEVSPGHSLIRDRQSTAFDGFTSTSRRIVEMMMLANSACKLSFRLFAP